VPFSFHLVNPVRPVYFMQMISATPKEQIEELSERIAREFQPEKIILFGSYAYGEPSADSDIDLLVIMQFEGRQSEQAIRILNRLNVLVPIDLLVRRPEEVKDRLAMGDSFMREIVERGRVMYEAHHS
jgi:predicted nucleotidyltransferase